MKKNKKIGFITGILTGFFGSGGGSYLVPKLQNNLKFEGKEAHASSIAIILPTCIFSIIVYLLKVDINILNTLAVCVGGVVGGIVGGKSLQKIKSKTLNKFFCIIIIFIGIKLLL